MTSGEPGRRHALARLRAAILDGDAAPGQRLVEEELATTFGVTRASVITALREADHPDAVEAT
jgi:DNA-binding GntR family transcriptional regulator